MIAGGDDLLASLLALVLAAAALHKAVSPRRLSAAAARLTALPLRLGPFLAGAAALTEAGAAAALLVGGQRTIAALAAAGLWALYGTLLLAARRRGDADADCGCSFTSHRPGIDRFAVIRAFSLAALALLLAALPGRTVLEPETLPAAFAFFALLLAAGELAALPRRVFAR